MKKILVIVAFAAFLFASCTGPLADAPKVYNRAIAEDTGKPSLLLVGDSRVTMWPAGHFSDYSVFNLSWGGSASTWSAYAIAMQTRRYDVIIISTGVNDIEHDMTLSDTGYWLTACVNQAKLKSGRVFLTTIPGVRVEGGFTQPYASRVSIRAAQASISAQNISAIKGIGCIDIASSLCSADLLRAEYSDGSGIHYNAAAYDVIAAMYLAALSE